ncbi:MAG TPA: hypothetical protein VGM18_13650 [Candidatus Sulfotelmatobacter sp.]|jgi:hypothetical protein
MDDIYLFDFFDFPQPPAFSLTYPSGPSLTAMAEPNSRKMHLFRRGDNHSRGLPRPTPAELLHPR